MIAARWTSEGARPHLSCERGSKRAAQERDRRRTNNAVDPPERRLPKSIVKQVESDGVGEQPSLQGQRDPVGVALDQAPGDEVRQAGPFADA